MVGVTFKEKLEQSVEKRTIDKLINTTRQSDDEFIISLFEIGETDEFTDFLKAKVEEEQSSYEVTKVRNEDLLGEEGEQTALVEQVVSEPIISAEEIRPELVDYIKSELMEKMQAERSNVIYEFINGRGVSQEEFYKLQLWSYFPVLGIPIYFYFLVVLSVNRRQKYAVTLQNYAKAQLKTFWIYLVAHASVLFVAVASMTSLVNIIQRGLAA